MRFFVAFALLLSLFSCKVRTMSDDELNALYDSIPGIRIYEMEYNDVARGKLRYHAVAETAEMFDSNDKNQIVVHSMQFEQYDNKENLSASGTAGKAVRYNNSGNVEITDNIRIYSEKEKVSIEGRYLLWQDKDRVLSGNITDEIRITKKDGTFFAGKGFYLDSGKNKAEFRNGVYGEYISDPNAEKEEKETPSPTRRSEEFPEKEVIDD